MSTVNLNKKKFFIFKDKFIVTRYQIHRRLENKLEFQKAAILDYNKKKVK